MSGCTCDGVLPWLRAEQVKGMWRWGDPAFFFEVRGFLQVCRSCRLHLVDGYRDGVFVVTDGELPAFRVGERVELLRGASRPASQREREKGG